MTAPKTLPGSRSPDGTARERGLRHLLLAVAAVAGFFALTLDGGLVRAAAPVKGADRGGSWGPVESWPVVGIHSHLMANGKVLVWDRDKAANGVDDVVNSTKARVWDPARNTFSEVNNGNTNLFCSGHAMLPDGRILVTGGHTADNIGVPHTNVFDPEANTWTRGPNMNGGRWYPTTTTIADGRVLTISGKREDGSYNNVAQVFDPATESWRETAPKTVPMYPYMYQSPTDPDQVFYAGPERQSAYLNTRTGSWSDGPVSTYPENFRGEFLASSAMYDGEVLLAGGGEGGGVASKHAEVIDLRSPVPAWQRVADMNYPRRYHDATLLPDGTTLVTGGMSEGSSNQVIGDRGVREGEIFDPSGPVGSWTTTNPMERPRGYHSTALLLPDARVLVAGSGKAAGQPDEYNAEIFSPPYLHKGTARPTIDSAPRWVGFGQNFFVGTPNATNATKVRLVGLGSVTHGFDMNQRVVTLDAAPAGGGMNVTAPANGAAAPPGHYMLFVVDANGVPSEAKIMSVGNVASNPGFEADGGDARGGAPPAGWSTWSPNGSSDDADYTEAYGGARTGRFHGTHWKGGDYEVYTYQAKNGLPDGAYDLSAWVRGSGGQTHATMDVKDYDPNRADEQVSRTIPRTDRYTRISIEGIQVRGGTATIGFYSKSVGGNWIHFDDVEFKKR